jgi:hypothetical protein
MACLHPLQELQKANIPPSSITHTVRRQSTATKPTPTTVTRWPFPSTRFWKSQTSVDDGGKQRRRTERRESCTPHSHPLTMFLRSSSYKLWMLVKNHSRKNHRENPHRKRSLFLFLNTLSTRRLRTLLLLLFVVLLSRDHGNKIFSRRGVWVYHHHHGIGTRSFFVVLFLLFFDTLSCSIIGGDYGRPEAQPARRLFFFLLFCFTPLDLLALLSCSERRVTISKGKKEIQKEKTFLIEFVQFFSSFI